MGSVVSYISGDRGGRRQGAFYKAYKINDVLGQNLLSLGIGKKQLFELHQIFNLIDKDSSGEINLIEFFDYIDLKRTRFSEKAFSVMDHDGSGEVDFVEFVLAVWNYCSFSRGSLVRYAFDLYDSDGSGEIQLAEATECVAEIWGSEWERNGNAQKVMARLESIIRSTPDNRLTVKMFEEFSQTHPMLLFPAFQMQTEIQNRILGERFWRRAAKRRSLVDSKELNVKNLGKLVHLSRQSSQKYHQSAGDVLHDNVFEEVNAAPRQRKRSSLEDLFLKAKSRTKVFLDARKSSLVTTGADTQLDSSTQATAVTTFDSAPSTTSPPKTKKPTSANRPASIETVTLPLANNSSYSQSSFTRPVSSSISSSPTHQQTTERSPKKKKKAKTSTGTGKTDLVIEDVAEAHA